MKKFPNFFMGILTVFLFVSCEKECELTKPAEPKVFSIEGYWAGTYTADLLPNDPPRYYGYTIKPGGKVLVEAHPVNNDPYYATGTWVLRNDTLYCDIEYPVSPYTGKVHQITSAYFDKVNGELNSGVWSNLTAPGGTGKFTMKNIE